MVLIDENKKKRNPLGIIIVILLAAAALSYLVFSKSKADPAQGGPQQQQQGGGLPVEGITVGEKQLDYEASYFGNILANESVDLSAEIGGRISAINFKEGTEIKKGTLLFKIEDSMEQATLLVAQATLQSSQNAAERHRALTESGAVSKSELDSAEANYLQALAQVKLAQANLSKTNIRAPFDGRAGIRQVSVGQTVTAGHKLVSFEQTNQMRVLFTVPEKMLAKIKPGQKVNFSSDLIEGKVEAEVNAIDSKISTDSRSLQVQAIADNKEGKLYSGQFVQVYVPVEQREASIVIPDQALVPLGDKIYVFKVADGKASKAEVKTGARFGSQVEITSGLGKGEVVVTAGQMKLQDGTPVQVSKPTFVEYSPPSEEKDK